MAMDQFIERFKTLRVHRSVTLHRQQIETIFCLLLYIFVFTFHRTFLHREAYGCNPCYGNLTRCHSFHSQKLASTCEMELRQGYVIGNNGFDFK